jgi:hypothetical protein
MQIKQHSLTPRQDGYPQQTITNVVEDVWEKEHLHSAGENVN